MVRVPLENTVDPNYEPPAVGPEGEVESVEKEEQESTEFESEAATRESNFVREKDRK